MLNEPVPVSEPAAPGHAFDLLEGAWSGEGTGEYPTIVTFHYREMLTFERRSETSLFYVQRTEKFLEGQAEPVTSHWESGFIEAPEEGELQLANVQIGGRGEVLTGYIERAGHSIKLVFKSQSLSNDTRMVATSRIFELEGDTLRYEMDMATTRVDELTRHVFATLRRVPG
mgnify:CR=1 FL=1